MYERRAVDTNRLQCVECGRVSGEERGWTARLTVDAERLISDPKKAFGPSGALGLSKRSVDTVRGRAGVRERMAIFSMSTPGDPLGDRCSG